MKGSFLLEIGCEEIPARMISGALDQLRTGIRESISRERLAVGEIRTLGTPRRLAVLVEGLPERQPDREIVVTGPACRVAYDSGGRPTRAAIGFAKAQGVRVEELQRVAWAREEHVVVRKRVEGKETGEILIDLIPRVLSSLTFPKTMRWGEGKTRFVRPVRWIVALLGSRPLNLAWAGVNSKPRSHGHRRLGSPVIRVENSKDFCGRLRAKGILLDPEERRTELRRQLESLSGSAKGTLVEDKELFETVIFLVERPLVILGTFGEEFLRLPEEILRISLRHHQKSFSVRGADGRLRNLFLAVADADADPDGTIRRGNEWVLRARLADARFFWEEDLKSPLEARCEGLKRVTFHKDLGSYHDKMERLVVLCTALGREHEVGEEILRTASRLAKCDLTTHLVGEFPELQGIMGGLFARQTNHPQAVCDAIYDQYLPRSFEDPCPRSAEGAILGIVDRLDTLCGMFLLGQIPSGSRDPFGLRRAAQGLCKISLEKSLGVSFRRLVEYNAALHRAGLGGADREKRIESLLHFLRERLAFVLVARGHAADAVEAVLRAGADEPVDCEARVSALEKIRTDPDFEALAIGFKRVRNILAGQAEISWNPDAPRAGAESALKDKVMEVETGMESMLEGKDYSSLLRLLASTRGAIDRFFDEVLVMDKDESVRNNRIGLLQRLSGLFLRVADLSCMETIEIPERGDGE
ncbi:MAG: glycine--tRNA ligase subunit beta [Acidobacteria bacterium]|nr:glycine--tRNA ligase subunit beta [Acidobacteriota bacterium]